MNVLINIEKFFLNSLLKIIMAGTFLVLLSNLALFRADTLSISNSAMILSACIIAYFIRNKYPILSVIVVTSANLLAMSYQRLVDPTISSTLSIVLITGFIISVMLKGRIMWIMHAIAFLIINTVFIVGIPDAVTAAITYSILYFILTYATAVLKSSYDRIHQYLSETNTKLAEKAREVEERNEELLQIQDKLNQLNLGLEKTVNERTAKLRAQNLTLVKYSYTNAHHLRGPVARLLGLAMVYNLEPTSNPDFYIKKMEDQAKEIDSVIRQIGLDLELNKSEV